MLAGVVFAESVGVVSGRAGAFCNGWLNVIQPAAAIERAANAIKPAYCFIGRTVFLRSNDEVLIGKGFYTISPAWQTGQQKMKQSHSLSCHNACITTKLYESVRRHAAGKGEYPGMYA